MPTVAHIRRIALALPEATEEVTWGSDLTFRVRGKIFAITGEEATGVSIKASPDDQVALIASDPEMFCASAYVGPFGWVTVDLTRVDPDLLERLLRDAWRRTAPRRLAATIAPTGADGGCLRPISAPRHSRKS